MLQFLLRFLNGPRVDRAVAGHTGHAFLALVQVLVLAMSFSIQVYSIMEGLRLSKPTTPRRRRR